MDYYYNDKKGRLRLVTKDFDIKALEKELGYPVVITSKEELDKAGIKPMPEYLINRLDEYLPFSVLVEAIAENNQPAIKKFQEHNKAVKLKFPKK